ncbi:DUF1275 family protein [Gordonia sp. DT219]|uniref:DUF1275 family protein n=1 Tax=Gordonia sp. DT219 TaxID=3416658 RepID=UPI003CF9A90B
MAAFALGVFVYALIKSGRIDHVLPHPLRWVMAAQALVLLAAGCVPLTVPHSYVTVPIAFMAGVQLGLFRNIGDFNYVAIATTGNLMRLVESAFGGVIDKDPVAITAFGIYVRVIGIFAGGAVIGAFATLAWH